MIQRWNPYYVAYAREHGKTCDEMLAFDKERAPGGHMGPYIRWNGERWREWRKLRGLHRDTFLSKSQQADFAAWLDSRLTLSQST
jgi:hypothetical protein